MDAPFPQGMLEDIQRYLEHDADRKPGQDVYPGVFETGLFFPLQRKNELAAMMRVARGRSPRTVMEIGADKGGGLYHWCKCLPTVTRAIACEVRGTPYRQLFEQAFPHIKFLWLDGVSSYDERTVTEVGNWLGTTGGGVIDALFIDGDKAAFDRDFEAYLKFTNKESVIFMHDIQDEAPFRAFDAMQKKHGLYVQTIIDTNESQEATDREAAHIPPANPHEAWLREWRGKSAGVGVLFLD